MVGITHHLVIHGIGLGVRAFGDIRAVVLVIKAVIMHRARRGTTRCDQFLRFASIGQTRPRRRRYIGGAVSHNAESGRAIDSVAATLIISDCHSGFCTHIDIIRIADGVFCRWDQCITVFHRHVRFLLRAVVGER